MDSPPPRAGAIPTAARQTARQGVAPPAATLSSAEPLAGAKTAALMRGRPLVKVCGLTRPEDVVLAAELGAWAVGFIFAPSPRRVTPERARQLVLVAAGTGDCADGGGRSDDGDGSTDSHRPLAVGVFGDTSVAAIGAAVDEVGLGAVQLHGAEPDASTMRRALADAGRHVLLIQAVAVAAEAVDLGAVQESVARARGHADVILFDTRSQGRSGGTGRTFPWDVVSEAAENMPYLVAGGIGPHNVREALSVSQAWGVDVSGGVESSPGVKDHDLLRALFAALAEST